MGFCHKSVLVVVTSPQHLGHEPCEVFVREGSEHGYSVHRQLPRCFRNLGILIAEHICKWQQVGACTSSVIAWYLVDSSLSETKCRRHFSITI